MGFINPFLLFGLLAAFIPFLIHLWSRRQAKVVDFSSLRFLLAAHRKRVRRLQIKQWIILLLRMLIIILIVLAIARPLLKNKFSFAGTRSKTSCVIILDNSYSMGYQSVKGQRFDMAKKKALEVVDSLEKGDSASLILMSDVGKPVFRKLTSELTLVRSAIQNSILSNRTTSIPPSIKLASSILANSNVPNKEIYLITDFDQNGWQGWGKLEIEEDIKLFTLKTRFEKVPANLAIQNIRFSNKLISVNSLVRLEAEITNFSQSSFNDIAVTLYIDGEKRRSVNIKRISAGETVLQTFTYKFNSPGTHTGKFTVVNDRLTVDDVRYFAVKVYGQIEVLCVSKNPLYLSLALNPDISTAEATSALSESVFVPTVSTPDEIEQMPLEKYDVIILADIADVNPSVLKRLRNFVTNGKSLLIFVSDEYKDEYNDLDLLPAKLNKVVSFDMPVKIAEYEESHPVFNRVLNLQHFSGTNSPSFYKAYTLDLSEDARTIAEFSNNIPAIIEEKTGRGSVFLFNTSASELSWSNLILKPSFLPLLHQTAIYTVWRNQNRFDDINLEVGNPFSGLYYDFASSSANIQNMSQNSNSSSTVVVGNNGVIKYEMTQSPGIYRIEIQGKEKIKRDFFAVNIDTNESNLTVFDMDKALNKFNRKVNSVEASYSEQGELKRTLNSYRMGKEIWSELLIAAIVLMFVEVYLANHKT